MTLPLRKTMTNLTSVTVSTAGATFLPPPLLSSPVPMLPWLWHPQPQAPWLLLLGLHPSLHACPLREGTTSFGCRRRHSPTQEASCLWCPAPVSGSACSVAFF